MQDTLTGNLAPLVSLCQPLNSMPHEAKAPVHVIPSSLVLALENELPACDLPQGPSQGWNWRTARCLSPQETRMWSIENLLPTKSVGLCQQSHDPSVRAKRGLGHPEKKPCGFPNSDAHQGHSERLIRGIIFHILRAGRKPVNSRGEETAKPENEQAKRHRAGIWCSH